MKKTQNILNKIYHELFSLYWPQWWWPIIFHSWKNNYKQWNNDWYHILDYSFPRNQSEIFEICLWAILTQNTSFNQVVLSLNNLKLKNTLDYKSIEKLNIDEFKNLIKPSWFFNQKSVYILNFINYFKELDWKIPSREEILKVKWIWQETADSILLYAYKQPEFVVDSYTKRFFIHLWLIDENYKYTDIKNYVEKEFQSLGKTKEQLVVIYQEFHALIVNHAKLHYSKKPYWKNCNIKERI